MSEFSRKITIYVESGQAQVAYDQLVKAQDKLTQQVKKYADAGKDIPANLTAKLDGVNKSLEQQKDILSGKLTPSLKELQGTYSNLSRELARMREQDPGFDEKRKQTLQAKAALEEYQGSLGTVKKSFADMVNTAKGVALGVVVAGAVQALGAAAMGAFNAVTGAVVDLDSSVKNLSAITGAAGTDLDFLKQKAIEMASSGSRSAKDYVEAMKFIASAKPELLENKEALVEVTKAAKLLATAGGLDLQDAAKRLTDAMNQFGAPASEAADYVDRLAAAAKYGSAEIPDITEALLQFGPIAKQAGVSVNESAAAIELLAEKGYKGAEAGTKLRNILLNLSAVDALPKEAQDAMAKYGVNVSILKDKTLSLSERLQEMSKVSGDATAMLQIFDKQNVSAATSLLTNVARYTELNEQIKENGVASDQAGKNTDTLSASWARLKNVMVNLFLNMDTSRIAKMVKSIGDAVTEFGKWAGLIKSTSQLLEEERQQLLLTETQITSYNVGTKERTTLINELQQKYPQYLGNLDAEKASNEEIAAAIASVNNQLLFKIALAQKDELLQKQLGDVAKATNRTAEAKLAMEKELTKLLNNDNLGAGYRKANKEMLEGLPTQTKVASILSGMVELYGVSSLSLTDLASAYDTYEKSMSKSNIALDKKNELMDDFLSFQKTLKETLGMEDISTPTTPGTPAGTGGGTTTTKTDNKDADLDRFKQFYQKVIDLKVQSEAALLSEDEKEIASLKVKHAALDRELQEFHAKGIINLTKFNETQRLITEDFSNELERLNAKHFDKRSENEYKASLFATQNVYEREIIAQKEILNKGEINEAQYHANVGELQSQAIKAKIVVTKDYTATVATAEKDLVKLTNDLYLQDEKNKADSLKRKTDGHTFANSLNLETAQITGDKGSEKDLKLQLLQEQYEEEQVLWKDNQEALTAIEANYAAKRAEINKNENIAKAQEVMGYVQQVVGIMNNVAQILNNQDQAEINASKKKHTAQVKHYDEELKHKRISQKQHDKLVDAANKEQATREDEIKRKQFERNKAMQIVNAVIGTALAVVQAIAQLGPIAGGIAGALVAVVGATQIGIIASQQYEGGTYAEGTDSIAKGPAHSQGGIKMIDAITGRQVGEMEGDEAIISAPTTGANMPIIRRLLAAKGKPINIDSNRSSDNIRMFAMGAASVATADTQTSTAGKQTAAESSNELGLLISINGELLSEMKKFNEKKLSISVQDVNDKNDLLDYITSKAV